MKDCKCDRCGGLWDTKALTTREVGRIFFKADGRDRSLGGARIGWLEDHTVRRCRPETERICPKCLGQPDPRDLVQAPIAKRAANAWEAAIAENPELARFAPKRR